MNNYINELDNIKAGESFKAETIELLNTTPSKRKSRRKFTALSAVAASLAVIIGLTALWTPSKSSKNTFALTAYAAEATDGNSREIKLDSNNFKTLGKLTSGGSGMSLENDTPIDADIQLQSKLGCMGNNIKKITYSIDNGVVGVLEGSELIQPEKGKKSYHGTGHGMNNKVVMYYDEITVRPENQEMYIEFNMYKKLNAEERKIGREYHTKVDSVDEPFWVKDTDPEPLKKIVESFYDMMLGDNLIHVTVTYTDGTTETKNLGLKAICKTRKDMFENYDGTKGYAYDFAFSTVVSAKLV